MLGLAVSETTVSRYVRRLRERNPDPELLRQWVAFLRNHKGAIAGMDFFTVPTATMNVLYGFFVLLLSMGFAIVSMLACLLTCCIAALPYIGTVVLLPLWVTYRYLSLEWLAQFDSGFDVFTPLETASDDEAAFVSEGEG